MGWTGAFRRIRALLENSEPARAAAEHPDECILVTDGDTRPALAAVRSLGGRGLAVHVLASRSGSLAGVSRYCAGESVVPDPAREPGAWVAALKEIAQARCATLVLPITEVALGALYAEGAPAQLPLAAPPRAAYEIVTDKHRFLARAAEAGIDVPRSLLLERPAERLGELPAEFAFPVVLKARRSRWLDDAGRWREGGVRLVRDEASLRAAAADPGMAGGALLQEFVPGHGEGLFVLADRGRVVARFAHRRLREKPPTGGVSVLCESIAPDPQLVSAGERLIAALDWHGVAMLEFRRSPDPAGRAVAMELNPRLWGSLQLAIDAGVDFPALWLALLRGLPLGAVEPRVGARSRWLLGDLDHLLIALRRPAMRRAIGRSAVGVVAAFLASFFDGSRLDVLRPTDPRPFLRELRAWRP